MIKKHYRVYYLLDSETRQILYVGRTRRPVEERLKEHRQEKRIPKNVILGLSQRFTCARASKNAETRAIKKHKPKFNRVITHKVR